MRRSSPPRHLPAALSSLLLALIGRESPAQAAHPSTPRATGACFAVITGEVRSGQSFRAPINASLQLLLDPVPHGWILRVLPTTGLMPSEDMAELATPPFRSINPLLLTTDFGFRAQDVVGWNSRSFHYIRRHADLAAAEQAFHAVVASSHPTSAEQLAVVRVAADAAEGRLEILDSRLVPGTADQTSAAALVATHFLTTAHTILPHREASTGAPAGSHDAGLLGQVEWLRFRASFEGSGHPCH